MSFHDLPEDWPTIPLADADHIANVLDIFVGLEARHRGALMILICDEQRRPLQPIQIDDLPPTPPAFIPPFLERLATTIAERPGLSILCAIARSRRHRVTAADHAWRRCIESAFAGHVEVLGVHVVTHAGSIPITAPADAA